MEKLIIMQSQIEAFLEKLEFDGKSQRDIGEYRRNLNSLYQTAKEAAEGNNCVLTREVLEMWKHQQLRRGIASGTMTNRVVKINQFLRYLDREDLCFQRGGRQNLAGRQFGNLVAIEPVQEKHNGRSICWKCRCLLCGKEKLIPANQLTKGVQTSCGCHRSKRLQESNGYIDGTCLKNIFSDKIGRNNTSGYKGVFRKRGKWAASIQYKKKNYYLGSYERLEDAVAARKQAENQVREDAELLLEQFRQNVRESSVQTDEMK